MGSPEATDRSIDTRNPDWIPKVLFAVALAASAVFLLNYRLDIGFVADDLTFLKERSFGGIDTMLMPHGENIVVLQAILYRLSYIVFGIGSSDPVQVISLTSFLLSVVALFIWVRGRVGDWLALAATIPVLFFGASWDDLLWAFQIGYTASVAAGLTGLILLERGGRFSRPVACIALIISVGFSSLGLPFLCGAGVLLLRRDGWAVLRNYVVLVPALMFIVWYIGWGSDVESQITLNNLLDIPRYVAVAVKSVVMGLTGLHRLDTLAGDILGWLATAGLTALIAVRLIRARKLPWPFLVALVAGLVFWSLACANQVESGVRSADQTRYMYPGAIFVLMITAGAFEGFRPRRAVIVVALGLAAISVVCSLDRFDEGSFRLRLGALVPKAGMTALDIAGPAAVPGFQVDLSPFYSTSLMSQEQFRALEDRYGRAGWSDDDIAGLGQPDLNLLDLMTSRAVGLRMKPAAAPIAGSCQTTSAGPAPGQQVARIVSGTVSLTPARNQNLTVVAGRFASADLSPLGKVPAGTTGRLTIPDDLSDQPWRVSVIGEGPVRVCVSPDP